jgi:hypothetical protein
MKQLWASLYLSSLCESAADEDALNATSTDWAPWYVVPADHKWATRAVVADILTTTIGALDLSYPEVTAEQHKSLEKAREQLDRE